MLIVDLNFIYLLCEITFVRNIIKSLKYVKLHTIQQKIQNIKFQNQMYWYMIKTVCLES